MLFEALIAATIGVQPIPVAPISVAPDDAIPLVLCPDGKGGGSAGTAFRIGPHLLLSVKHVTNAPNCEIDGQPIHIVYTSPTQDFSILSDSSVSDNWVKVNCGGFVAGRTYLIIGHPRAISDLVVVPATATGDSDDGLAILVGIFTAQPGHSGSPIIDAETGEVVGATNTANWEDGITGSTELKGTPICRR